VDKKAKKRLEVIRKKLQHMQQQLSGAKQQNDEPGEVERLEKDIAALEQEAKTLRAS